ncbi:hypothetical protein KAH55_03460 [bacterium]|nr:hypothetical protein [bacterium]
MEARASKKIKPITLIVMALLCVVFAIALTSASLELPRLADTVLQQYLKTPDAATGGPSRDYKPDAAKTMQ